MVDSFPTISVVICTYNRQAYIVSCLQHLAKQSLPLQQYEVIVVDNCSTDETALLVKHFLHQNSSLPFRYVFEENKGLSYARGRGVAESKSEIILYIDDDAEADEHLLKMFVDFFYQQPNASGAGGRIIPKFTERPEPKWISRWLDGYLVRVDHGGSIRLFEGRMKYPAGCNMVYRKKYLLEAGGFNPELTFRGDDKYIFHAVKAINPNIYYVPEALVNHNIPGKRLDFAYFKTLFLKTGNEEKKRVSAQGLFALIKKFGEYIFKFAVACAIWIGYAINGKEIKGRYVFYSQWFTLKGFLMKNVFVR
ncbi:MAG TPA: glycosyltransferase [Ferruginibacter sp.]|nr:glycosyltransferase [Ferruginibacter sp.]